MIIDLVTQSQVVVFKEAHIAGLSVHIPKGHYVVRRSNQDLSGGAAARTFAPEEDLEDLPAVEIHAQDLPTLERHALERPFWAGPYVVPCLTVVLPRPHKPGAMHIFAVRRPDKTLHTKILVEGDRIGVRTREAETVQFFGVEGWGASEPVEQEQEAPYVQNLATADGAIIAAQRNLRNVNYDTNLRMELESLGWTVVPKTTYPLSLEDLNDLQLDSIDNLAGKYFHGWHKADLKVRKDAKEEWFEADWLLTIVRQIALLRKRLPRKLQKQ